MPIKEFQAETVQRIRKLEVLARKTMLSRVLEGNWTAIFKGRGMEFSGYRQYSYGDDASLIDWKASLRAKQILIKEYEEERNLNVFFLIDVSNSMLFSSTGKLKCEYVAEMVASMSLAISRSGDAVGLGLFNDRITVKIHPNIGRIVHYRMIKELINPVNYGGNFDFVKVAKFLLGFLNTKALIIIISDFLGLKDDWQKYLKILSQKYDIIGIMVRDPRDRELPKNTGQYVLEDPYSNERMVVDVNTYADKYKAYVEKEEAMVRNEFKKVRGGFLLLQTDQDFLDPVMKYFKNRAQLLRYER
jgi:uncharacterized protein (DUF58 family)